MKTILLALILCASASAQIAGPPFAFWKSGATVFSPLSIDSCFVWYDASDSTTITHTSQRVSTWTDKTAFKRDATQAASGNQPLLVYGAINTKPAMYFLPTRSDELRADSIAYVSHKLTAFVVGTMETATAAFGRMLSLSATSQNDFDAAARAAVILRNNATQNINGYRTAALSNKNVTYATAYQATSIFDGTNHTMRVDGSAGTAAASTGLFSTSSPTGVITVGNSTSANGVWQGYVAEVIVYKKALTAGEISQVETYLKNKWGTP